MTNPKQQNCKITLYWLEESRAQRIAWLLEELNLEYEIKVFKRTEIGVAPKELKEIHPLGKSPLIGIQPEGADKPIILAESGVIVEYLAEHFGRELIPSRYPEGVEGGIGKETEEWMRYKYLMNYAEGSLMGVLVLGFVVSKIAKAPLPFFLKPLTGMIANKINSSYIDRELKTHMDFLETYLAEAPNSGDYFCGSTLSGADIQMLFPLEGAFRRVPLTETNYPKLHSYVRMVQGREAYKRAAARATEAAGEEYVPFSDSKL